MNKHTLGEHKTGAFFSELKELMQKYGIGLKEIVTVSVVISQKHNSPAVFLRRNTTDQDIIKQVISSAYHGRPLIIMPQFTDTRQSIISAVEKGILFKDPKDNTYYYTFWELKNKKKKKIILFSYNALPLLLLLPPIPPIPNTKVSTTNTTIASTITGK